MNMSSNPKILHKMVVAWFIFHSTVQSIIPNMTTYGFRHIKAILKLVVHINDHLVENIQQLFISVKGFGNHLQRCLILKIKSIRAENGDVISGVSLI
ncbi:hypothetical protein QL285_044186 [Trifolium repens]|nr:hypothetical protein QL285_044186 [Trifolium repens]